MKIALCISGQPRGISKTCDFLIDSVIKPNSITDIFIHTWYDKSMDNIPFDSAQPGKSNRVGSWCPHTDFILIDKLKPTLISVESPKKFEEFSHLQNRESANQTALASMFYSANIANKLKCLHEQRNNFIYDVVIKTRIDLNYYNPVIIENLIDNNLKTSVYVPSMYQYMRQGDSYPTKSGWNYSSMSDTFIFGSSENMNKVCSVFEDFEKHHGEIWPYVYGEAYLGYVVRGLYKIPVEMKDIQYTIYK